MTEAAARRFITDARSFFRGRVLCAAVRLRVPDHLDDPRTVDELATLAGCDESSIRRLARALAAIGVVQLNADGVVTLTPDGTLLRRDHPESVWTSVVFWADLLADNWSYLDQSVRTGETAWSIAERDGLQLRFAREGEGGAPIFHGAMSAANGVDAHRPIVDAYDFTGAGVIADLGGGGGGLLGAVLVTQPTARGILVERGGEFGGALGGAKGRLAEVGVLDRCDLVEHDLMQSVPVDADVYMMKHVLHGCSKDDALRILGNLHERMSQAGKLLVIEADLPDAVVTPSIDAEWAAMLDLTMLVTTGGRERTHSEWGELLGRGGFDVKRGVPVKGMAFEALVIIEATPR